MLLVDAPVLVDFDSVVCDFDKKCCDWFNVRNGTNFTRADINTWDWVRDQPGADEFWSKVFHSSWFTGTLAPLPGSLESLLKLADAGAEVHVVTARPRGHKKMLDEWFVDNRLRPGHGFKLEFTSDKHEYFKFHDMVTWFEDGPHNAADLAELAPGYLIDMPYNEVMPPTRYSIARVPTLKQGVENFLTLNVNTR